MKIQHETCKKTKQAKLAYYKEIVPILTWRRMV